MHMLGMNVAAATHGNPWVCVLREEEDLETSEDIVWREADDYYLHSHCLPPEGAPFWLEREWPWICDCCGEVFESAESFKDPEKIAALRKMPDQERRNWQTQHWGQVPLQAPLFYLDPLKVLAPMFHTMENIIDHRWKHLIWKRAKTNELQYDVNQIIKTRVGSAHLPPRRGDKGTMCKAFIGGELYKMRGDGQILADIISLVAPKPKSVPQEVALEEVPCGAPTVAPPSAPVVSSSRLDDLDQAYLDDSDDSDDEALVAEEMGAVMDEIADLAERVAYSDLHPWDLISMAFDLAWDYIDALMDEDGDDSTQELRDQRASKLRQLAKECNRAENRALSEGPVFSEYQRIIEHVIPVHIGTWGKLVLRANEQGQESLGALLKRILKNGVNKRRKIGTYTRKGKFRKDGEEGPEVPNKVSKFEDTATKESLAMLALKVDAMHDTQSHMTAKRRLGKLQKAIIQKGQSLKKERALIATSSCDYAPPSVVALSKQAGVLYDNIQLDAQEY